MAPPNGVAVALRAPVPLEERLWLVTLKRLARRRTALFGLGVVVGSVVGCGVLAPPHAAIRSTVRAALRTGPIADSNDPLHLRVYPAVVREGSDLVEGDRPSLIRIDREVERTAR